MWLALKSLIFVCIAYMGVCALVHLFQEKLIFFPDTVDAGYRYRFSVPFEEVWVDVEDARLHGLLLKSARARGVIVYFHGNAGNVRDWGQIGEDLARYDHDVLIIDYRGYGKSTGRIHSQDQLLADAEAVFAYARSRYEEKEITLYGRSLGSAFAVWLAGQHPGVKQLILETPFLSLKSIAQKQFPWVPSNLLKYPLPSDEWAPAVKCPVLILHGSEDEVVPFASGEALRTKFSIPVAFVRVEGAHHNNLLAYPAYRDAVASVLR